MRGIMLPYLIFYVKCLSPCNMFVNEQPRLLKYPFRFCLGITIALVSIPDNFLAKIMKSKFHMERWFEIRSRYRKKLQF